MTYPFPWFWLWRLLGTVAVLWVLINTWQLWLLVLSALILTASILPVALWGQRRRIPRIVTIIAVYIVATLVISILGLFLVPVLMKEGGEFARQLPAIVANLREWLGDLTAIGVPQFDVENLAQLGPALIEKSFMAAGGVLGGVLGLLLILFLTVYMVADSERISRGLLASIPVEARPKIEAIAGLVLQRMGGYVRGQILASCCVGVILVAGLWLLGVPYAILIGGLAATLNVIPFLGSTLASVIGILVALNISLPLAIWTSLLLCGAYFIEGKLLVPQLVGLATGLHPLAVMLVILVGAKLGGLLGALVSVPLLAGGWEIVRILWVDPINAAEGTNEP